ncbi:MAG: DNA polymerase III subunit [Syntrophomonadaceae bacterium]|nr:DNA polymerase III subunit [Syntrophomonadaceae bacterium]
MSKFANVVGQTRAIRFLEAVLESGRFQHAYLFIGPPGVGKTRAARIFAREILTRGSTKGADLFNQGQHPDYFFTRRDKARVSIEEVRRMEEWLAYRPYMASHRVVLLPEAHLLTPEAGNALLKTLEEPPEYAVFLLISDQQDVLPTIVSRCQEVRFFPLPVPEIEQVLLGDGVPPDKARVIAQLSRGSVKTARILTGHSAVEQAMLRVHFFLEDISRRGEMAILEKAEALEKDEVERTLFLTALESVLRDVVVMVESGREDLLLFRESAGLAGSFRGKGAQLREVLMEITSLQKKYWTNVNPLLINLNLLFRLRQAFKEG